MALNFPKLPIEKECRKVEVFETVPIIVNHPMKVSEHRCSPTGESPQYFLRRLGRRLLFRLCRRGSLQVRRTSERQFLKSKNGDDFVGRGIKLLLMGGSAGAPGLQGKTFENGVQSSREVTQALMSPPLGDPADRRGHAGEHRTPRPAPSGIQGKKASTLVCFSLDLFEFDFRFHFHFGVSFGFEDHCDWRPFTVRTFVGTTIGRVERE
jgi:hypothetical protein